MQEKLTELLGEVKVAHDKSKVKKVAGDLGAQWNYELIISALEKKQPLILGFNPGVDSDWEEYQKGNEYQPQTSVYPRAFLKIYKGSIQRIVPYIDKHFPDISLEKANHSNYCFFRSADEGQIEQTDIELCKPIFNQLLEVVEPSIVFCFSKQLKSYLVESGNLSNYENKWIKPSEGRNSCEVAVGNFSNGTRVIFMPHPNNWRFVKKEVIEKAWEFAANRG